MFEGDVGENHTEQSHWSIDDWHTQREGPWDGLAYRDTQVDGGGIVFKSSAARRTVRLQLFRNEHTVVSTLIKIPDKKQFSKDSESTKQQHILYTCSYSFNSVSYSLESTYHWWFYSPDPQLTCGQSPVARNPWAHCRHSDRESAARRW